MWEDLKAYKQLEKEDINPSFKKLGECILSHLDGYSLDQTNSLIKLYRVANQLEQSIFIEKSTGTFDLRVVVCIKPIDFYIQSRFTMINIVPLGDIMQNFRRTSFPLTQEWDELAVYLANRIKNEIENYFQKYNTYEKIIEHRNEIDSTQHGMNNQYELLIYAAIKTGNKALLNFYLDNKISVPTMRITHSEFLKREKPKINESDFLKRLKELASAGDFESIEAEIKAAL